MSHRGVSHSQIARITQFRTLADTAWTAGLRPAHDSQVRVNHIKNLDNVLVNSWCA
jgi:hypothetical protein